jgi:CRP-like cAMP-binding protein
MLRNVQSFKLALLGPGQLFGDDDVLFDRPHTSTIICRSAGGVLIQMNGIELLKKMKSNEECWNIF